MKKINLFIGIILFIVLSSACIPYPETQIWTTTFRNTPADPPWIEVTIQNNTGDYLVGDIICTTEGMITTNIVTTPATVPPWGYRTSLIQWPYSGKYICCYKVRENW